MEQVTLGQCRATSGEPRNGCHKAVRRLLSEPHDCTPAVTGARKHRGHRNSGVAEFSNSVEARGRMGEAKRWVLLTRKQRQKRGGSQLNRSRSVGASCGAPFRLLETLGSLLCAHLFPFLVAACHLDVPGFFRIREAQLEPCRGISRRESNAVQRLLTSSSFLRVTRVGSRKDSAEASRTSH